MACPAADEVADMIQLKEVCKFYQVGDERVRALDHAELRIRPHEFVSIIGPSGSGKSTFLRCLNCMEDPTGGSIYFDGEDLADMRVDINKHRENIGMVFQHFNLFPNMTVLENITLAPINVKGMSKEAAEEHLGTKIYEPLTSKIYHF